MFSWPVLLSGCNSIFLILEFNQPYRRTTSLLLNQQERYMRARDISLPWVNPDPSWLYKPYVDHSPHLPGRPTGVKLRKHIDKPPPFLKEPIVCDHFGRTVRRARKKLKLTQAQLAEHFDVPLSRIKRIESGRMGVPIQWQKWAAKQSAVS